MLVASLHMILSNKRITKAPMLFGNPTPTPDKDTRFHPGIDNLILPMPRQLPVQVGIRSSTDQWLSAVKQLVCSTDQSLSDVKEPAFLNGPMVKQYL